MRNEEPTHLSAGIGSGISLSEWRRVLVPLLVVTLAVSPPVLVAQEPTTGETEMEPPIVIESVTVEPSTPGPDTLCRLRVELRNRGSEIASQLDFSVKVNDQEVAVYRNQLFMYPIPAGGAAEVPLYNFWTTETSRPMPSDGKLTVEVVLKDARWMKVEEDEEGVEVWTPLGDIEGLPVSSSVSLTMSR